MAKSTLIHAVALQRPNDITLSCCEVVEPDFSGLVYHAGYLRFMERGRSDYLRLLDIGHGPLAAEEGNPAFAVRHLSIDFLRPAKMDDVVEVETRLADATGARIVLRQAVRRGDTVLAEAEIVVVMVDRLGKPRRIPAFIRDRLTRRQGAGA